MNPESQADLKREIAERLAEDRRILDQLREEIRPLRSEVRRIQPRSSTSISLVGADGGNNRIQFDPFLVQLVRVVDSSNNEYCLEAITPTTSVAALSQRQFDADGRSASPLGNLMYLLNCRDLTQLSHMIRRNEDGQPTSPSWVQVYRELMEWAILLTLVQNRHFGTDTLIVFDGLLRSVVFAGDLFRRYIEGIHKAINETYSRDRRRIFLVGMAKHSKVLSRYRLAMALEGILTTDYPAYLEVPREIEERAYLWSEYARGNDIERQGDVNRFAGGKMFFVKFGSSPRDPIWPVDVFEPQVGQAHTVLGHMLSDAINGFPLPFYPRCLQKAHENAALVDFDFDMLQEHVLDGLRGLLGPKAPTMDVLRLQESDPAHSRYS